MSAQVGNLHIYNQARAVPKEALKEIKGGRLNGNIKDLTGKMFGKLTAMYYVGANKHKKAVWHVKCECGNEIDVVSSSLSSGNTLSCGCLQKEKARNNMGKLHDKQWSNDEFREFKRRDMKERFTTHGARSRSNLNPLYSIWRGMFNRCRTISSYKRKRISVCTEWGKSFVAFQEWAMSHGYEKGKHLDRVDNAGSYEPNNCQFLTEDEHHKKTALEVKRFFSERRMSHG